MGLCCPAGTKPASGFPGYQVTDEVYPYARKLDSLVKAYNPCARTVFYMTWGRKNGDVQNCPFFPPICTYLGMDSLLQLRYVTMADDNRAVISPVAKVWRKLRTQPTLELYNADESHPSMAGSYATACSFYSIFFRKNPILCSYTASLSPGNATIIKNAARQIVFDSLDYWYRFDETPLPDVTYQVNGNTVNFNSNVVNATSYFWKFGDGETAAIANPSHTYAAAGNYSVSLIIGLCGHNDTISKTVNMGITGIENTATVEGVQMFPNPATKSLNIQSQVPVSCLYIYDRSGRMVLQSITRKQKDITLDIYTLLPGVYHLVIDTGNDRRTHFHFNKL